MKNGKQKGDTFENVVCRDLSNWLVDPPEGETWKGYKVWDLPFRRRFTDTTPLDGHWAGKGDILHRPDIEFPFAVECKHVEGWDLDQMISNEMWEPWSWWGQCKEQADVVGLVPLLVLKRNRRKVYSLLHEETAKWLALQPSDGRPSLTLLHDGEVLRLALLSDLMRVARSSVFSLRTTTSGRMTKATRSRKRSSPPVASNASSASSLRSKMKTSRKR